MKFTNNRREVFFPMNNKVHNYPWGSKTSLCDLFGMDNLQCKPMAELWMGAHPNGCSSVTLSCGTVIPLSELINQDPNSVLSPNIYEQFSELPFLFKVLAAENALSVQVHPSKEEAEKGYQRENAQGIPLNAFERNYKDPNHKPELVYALTDYKAMNGFRRFDEIESLLRLVKHHSIKDLVGEFAFNKNSDGLKSLFRGVLSIQGDELKKAIEQLLITATVNRDNSAFETVLELSQQYQCDVGLFAPLMLNVITLKPGQAMYLDAQTPHAYLNGTGLEIMANSDNVLRAGLTPKHIDIEELVCCTLFEEKPINTLLLEPTVVDGVLSYPVPVSDFEFFVCMSPLNKEIKTNSCQILLPLDADLELSHSNCERILLRKGQSVFVPAYVGEYVMNSEGRVAVAHC